MNTGEVYEKVLSLLKKHMQEPEAKVEAEVAFNNDSLFASRVRKATSDVMSLIVELDRQK